LQTGLKLDGKRGTIIVAKTKSNKQFMILSALGIFFVVDAHALIPIGFFTDLFEYNTFCMPMFVFISGYFFKMEALDNVCRYIVGRIRTLLVPFFCWNLAYGVLIQVLRETGIISYGYPVSLYTLFVEPFLDCYMFEINNPAWFVPALFLVVCVYALLRKPLRRIWNEWLAMLVLLAAGTACVYFSRKGYNQNPWYLLLLKTFFLMQFYQLGVLYKAHLEKIVKRIPKVICLFVPVLINASLLWGVDNLMFLELTEMAGFTHDHYLFPFITVVTGTLFWLTIADLLVPALGESPLINYISNNTYSVMMHHIFWFNVFNVVVAILVKLSILNIPFDFARFRETAWYRFGRSHLCNAWYFVVGVSGPILMKYCFDQVMNKIKRQK